jgi:hypothetical protein
MIARDDHGERGQVPTLAGRGMFIRLLLPAYDRGALYRAWDKANKPGRRMLNPMTQRKQFVNRRVKSPRAEWLDAGQALDFAQPAARNMTRTLQPGPADAATPSPETVESQIDARWSLGGRRLGTVLTQRASARPSPGEATTTPRSSGAGPHYSAACVSLLPSWRRPRLALRSGASPAEATSIHG